MCLAVICCRQGMGVTGGNPIGFDVGQPAGAAGSTLPGIDLVRTAHLGTDSRQQHHGFCGHRHRVCEASSKQGCHVEDGSCTSAHLTQAIPCCKLVPNTLSGLQQLTDCLLPLLCCAGCAWHACWWATQVAGAAQPGELGTVMPSVTACWTVNPVMNALHALLLQVLSKCRANTAVVALDETTAARL